MNQRFVDLREELRSVQGAVRQEIDSVSNRLRLINTIAAPVLVIVIGLVVLLWNRVRLWSYLRRRRAGLVIP
jgi:hypothetical protein